MPADTTVPESMPEKNLSYAEKAWGIIANGGAFGLAALAMGFFGWKMVERTDKRTDEMIAKQERATDKQIEQANATLTVVGKNTEAFTTATKAIKEVSEAVEANRRATDEIARDVRDLRELRKAE